MCVGTFRVPHSPVFIFSIAGSEIWTFPVSLEDSCPQCCSLINLTRRTRTRIQSMHVCSSGLFSRKASSLGKHIIWWQAGPSIWETGSCTESVFISWSSLTLRSTHLCSAEHSSCRMSLKKTNFFTLALSLPSSFVFVFFFHQIFV